jgi:hypothetical protein
MNTYWVLKDTADKYAGLLGNPTPVGPRLAEAAERWSGERLTSPGRVGGNPELDAEIAALPKTDIYFAQSIMDQYASREGYLQSLSDAVASGATRPPSVAAMSVAPGPFRAEPKTLGVTNPERDAMAFAGAPAAHTFAHEGSHLTDENFARSNTGEWLDYFLSPPEIRANWTLMTRRHKSDLYEATGNAPIKPDDLRVWGRGLLDSIRAGGEIDTGYLPADQQEAIRKLPEDDYKTYRRNLWLTLPSIVSTRDPLEFLS